MAKRYFVVICVVMVAVSVLLVHAADRPAGNAKVVEKPGAEHPPSNPGRPVSITRVDGASFGSTVPRAFGTVAYDTTSISAVPSLGEMTFGNRFNSALTPGGTAIAPVQVSGSVTHLAWGMWGTTTQTSWGTFWLTVFGPVSGTTAPVLNSWPLGGLGGPTPLLVSWTLATPVNYTGPSFLVGMLNSNSLATLPWNGPCPLLDSGTVGGQGHHGMGIFWGPGTGTGFFPITSLNAIMRPRGNVLTPVELMNFTVE
jgi:hypothetical protein